jgi:hypothetical protein
MSKKKDKEFLERETTKLIYKLIETEKKYLGDLNALQKV